MCFSQSLYAHASNAECENSARGGRGEDIHHVHHIHHLVFARTPERPLGRQNVRPDAIHEWMCPQRSVRRNQRKPKETKGNQRKPNETQPDPTRLAGDRFRRSQCGRTSLRTRRTSRRTRCTSLVSPVASQCYGMLQRDRLQMRRTNVTFRHLS